MTRREPVSVLKAKEKTERHRLSMERDMADKKSRAELFVKAAQRDLPEEQYLSLWASVKAPAP